MESYTGRVIRSIGGFYYVSVKGGGIFSCRARGLFRNENLRPVVGDMVKLHEVVDTDIEKCGSLDEVLPRKSELIRPVIANVDQAIVIFAAADPLPNLGLLDRFLCEMERQGVDSLVCFNKKDLVSEDELRRLTGIYRRAGYRVVCISAKAGRPGELSEHLAGRVSVLAGPSGAGKSTLVNSLQSELFMETGEISRKLGRGRHTTRRSELIAVEGLEDTFIADTPGFSSITPLLEDERELDKCFPELAAVSGRCRFSGCSHIRETDCAVKDAMQEGSIAKERYESYCALYEDIRSRRKY